MTVISPSVEAWIDVGGTFTDCFVRTTDELRRTKVLSSGRVPIAATRHSPSEWYSVQLAQDPDDFWIGSNLRVRSPSGEVLTETTLSEFSKGRFQVTSVLPIASANDRYELIPPCEAPVLAIHRLLQIPLLRKLPPLHVRMGTTRGTNALLTRQGAKTALAITAPFTDLLKIGDQTRPDLFALQVAKPTPLTEYVFAIRERLDASGKTLIELDEQHAIKQLTQALELGIESLAICLMHSYTNPAHELKLETLAKQVGFRQISCSSRIAPVIEIVPRAQTTVLDAYLSPIIGDYLSKISDQLGGSESGRVSVMTSAGGLVDRENYSGKDCILSGPAGGVIALRGISESLGITNLIGLDMGGTSTDVCRVSNAEELQFESTKANIRILTPTLPIETVAAGGGSVCWFDGVSLRVGPHSAGANPGPACYGRGGPLTLTDLNVFSGRIPAQQFPFDLDVDAIANRLEELLAVCGTTLTFSDSQQLVDGFRRIANEQMAEAVRTVSIAQGVDPRSHSLVGFGGAAGQHVCEIAELLGIDSVIDSPEAGLLSALGMGLADLRLDGTLAVYRQVESCNWEEIETQCLAIEQRLCQRLRQQQAFSSNIKTHRLLELRYQGTESSLTIPWTEPSLLEKEFQEIHQRRFGNFRPQHPIELVTVRLTAIIPASHHLKQSLAVDGTITSNSALQPITDSNARLEWDAFERDTLLPGNRIQGPAIVCNSGSTLTIPARWNCDVRSDGTLHLTQSPIVREVHPTGVSHSKVKSQAVDPVLRDCVGQRLSAIATQMGLVLQQTAVSVNVKQRRDFSCAVFNAQGELLANAPHVPVHLGAMGQTVRSILSTFPMMRAGDAFICNDPYRGGSHLPDVTLVTPVFSPSHDAPRMFVASRAHHADIGGLAPGSMSIEATRLGEEGAIIPPTQIASSGIILWKEITNVLESSPYPPRNIPEVLADMGAQHAAGARGVQLVTEYANTLGWETLNRYFELLLEAAEQRVRQFLPELLSRAAEYSMDELTDSSRQVFQFQDRLDDGTPIEVEIEATEEGKIRIDFTGTGPVSPTNFNANPSIVTAAILYVIRCLVADDMPLNEGVMRAIELVIPRGILNPGETHSAELNPAVAAGNVETSQRVVDVLLGALNMAAASQGTMNNLLFGNSKFGFYETICGGTGAVQGGSGADAVHSHMTNTRLTDPEVLESRFPVQLIDFRIRPDSGGLGQWNGGNGVVRSLKFLAPIDLCLLTSRRGRFRPFGLAGGQPGKAGRNSLFLPDGTRVELPGCCQRSLAAGSILQIETPGGGGFGPPQT